ncbi:TPA: efflux RND transporter periplasmic adaptor subunit [Candidatus Poribacteria bacterium]|nr:efflux RND transporter periplasmic adaptor subunit [Candidatus Poribacteria bacterium]
MRKSLIGIIATPLIIICFSAYLLSQNETLSYGQGTSSQKTEDATLVEVAPVEVGDITQELSLVGDIEPQTQVLVFPKISGKIQALNVEVGASVRKGDVLAVVEHKELELGVKQAKAALKAAQAALAQAKALSKIKVMSQVRQAQAGLSAVKAAFDQVKDISFTRTTTQIAQAEAGLEAIKASLKKIKEGAREEERKQVEAAVQQAKAGLDNAQINYKRMEKLFEQGAISKQTLEGVETQYTVAKAQYEAATQQLKLINEGAREEDIQAVEAQVKQAEAALQLAKRMADTKSWEKDIALAEAQVKQAEAGLEAAMALESAKSWEAEITGAETAVEQAKVALELALQRLSDATITAPISGIISQRAAELGGMASPQAPLFGIVDMDVVKAKVSVIESELYKIKQGNEALISVEALDEPVKGTVTLISPTLDKMSRTATVEISIDNSDYKLKPGMFARARIIYDKHTSTLLVPSSAVVYKDKKTFVYAVRSDVAKMVPVKIGFTSSDEDKTEIISGLSSGDKVIISGHFGLKDGTKVKAK